MTIFKLIPTILVKYILKGFHAVFSIFFKVDENKVAFASYRANELKDNLFYISSEMEKEYPHMKQVYLMKKFHSSLYGRMIYLVHMIKSCYFLATSRYFIIDDYYFPVYVINPRKNMDIIQLWHSSGAFKKFGLSTIGKEFGPSESYLKHVKIHGNYSKAYVSSKEVVPYFSEAFGMEPDKIKPLGIPRTDYFYQQPLLDSTRENFYRRYSSLRDKKIILYAPTFRGKSHYQDSFALPFDVQKMKVDLQDDYALVVHLHPYMNAKINQDDFVYTIDDFSIMELLGLTDILITDYSTVFFDYSLLDRPIIFYSYDLEEYKRERDFYYAYEDIIPGPIVISTEELIDTILANEYVGYQPRDLAKRFF